VKVIRFVLGTNDEAPKGRGVSSRLRSSRETNVGPKDRREFEVTRDERSKMDGSLNPSNLHKLVFWRSLSRCYITIGVCGCKLGDLFYHLFW